MFQASVPPAPGAKGTVKMSWQPAHGQEQPSARPRCRIVGKDEPRERFESLAELPDGRIVVGYRGRFIESTFGLQLRSADTLQCQVDIPGLAPPHCFSKDFRLVLTSGPYHGGRQATVRLASVDDWRLQCELPLRYPFAWLPDGRIVAASPHQQIQFDEKQDHYWHDGLHVTSESLACSPWLTKLAKEKDALIAVDVQEQQASKLNQEPLSLDEWTEVCELAVNDEHVFFGTESTLGAVGIASGEVVWRHHAPRPKSWDYYRPEAMAVSPDGKMLAVGARCGGAPSQNNVLVLDAATGEVILVALFSDTQIEAIAWHPTGWLAAASSQGVVRHLAMDGSCRWWKGSTRGIQSIHFVDGARWLLVCGAEKQFRLWPLLEDEIGDATV